MEPLEVLLRPFRIADLDQVHEIERHSFPKPWPKFSFVVFHYKEPDGFQVATSNDQIIGYAIMATERARIAPHERTAHLANLAIHTDFRQRGIGRRLVETMIAYAKNMNAHEITLEVSIHNGVARDLYCKFGFVERKTIRGYYGKREDAILMAKRCLEREDKYSSPNIGVLMAKKEDIRERVETVLNELIRPSLRADGGDIQVVDVNEDKGIVKLRLMGQCTGCPMSGNTFYNMVEKTLKEKIPEVKSVRQVSWGQYLEV